MDQYEAAEAARGAVANYEASDPDSTAASLRGIWLQALPSAPLALDGGAGKLVRDWGIQAPGYVALGVPVPVLTAMGREVGKVGRRRVQDFVPLMYRLWDAYGREGRIVGVVAMGPMELADPELVVPAIYDMAHSCVFWEDCDQLAMKALEPVVRRDPQDWLGHLGTWVTDENKWVRRAGMTTIGRLPMTHPDRTAECVRLLAPALGDSDTDVKRALSFALRTCARGDPRPVKAFIRSCAQVVDADSLWVLCDVVRSLWKKLLPEFAELLPIYQAWLPAAEPKARRSVEAAIRMLEG